jgi:hypothetical protein
VVVVESKFSDRLWLSFSLALAKPNKKLYFVAAVSFTYRGNQEVQLQDLCLLSY